MRKLRSVAMALPLAVLVFASVGVVAPLSVAAAPCATSTSGGKTTLTFCYTGAAQTWTVPAGVKSATFTVFGAAGGIGATLGTPSAAGLGGRAVATIAVVPGSTVTIVVGGSGVTPANNCATANGGAGGFNGGGAGGASGGAGACGGSGGGGSSDVRIGGAGLGNRVLVAGGGGGATNSNNGTGGAGGGTTGGTGGTGGAVGAAGVGGTQIAGGAGGTSTHNGAAGVAGGGGAGATNDSAGVGAGGGGGGWFGGGGGGAESDGNAGGGGGGSAHGPAGAVLTAGVRAGAGSVVISYTTPLPAASASSPSVPWLPIGGLAIGFAMIWFGVRRRRSAAA